MWILLIPVILCSHAVYCDVRDREIPDSIPLRLLISGVLATGLSWHDLSWTESLLGVALAFVLTVPFTLSEGVGGGGLKLLSGLGAWLGPVSVLSLLFWTAIAGVFSAIIAQARHKKDFPYAPAIGVGLLVAILFPSAFSTTIDAIRSVLYSA